MAWILLPIAFIAGVAFAVQFGVNAQLSNFIGSPLAAATVSFWVGAVALLAVSLIGRQPLPFGNTVTEAPWWTWTGGMLGAFVVVSSIILVPRIGAAATIGLVLAGQVVASIIIDHLGLLRVPVHELTAPRIAGAALIIAGVVLVQRF
jgi:bacterial/archaeal transporter family-2 protein